MRCRISYLLALGLALCATLAQAAGADPASQPPPSFKPGAKVDLAVTIVAPQGWHINYMLPLAFSFNQEYLKTAPIRVVRDTFKFTLEKYEQSCIAVIPVELKQGLADGTLSIPMTLKVSICEIESEQCVMQAEELAIPLVVKAKPAKNDPNSALDKGKLSYTIKLSA